MRALEEKAAMQRRVANGLGESNKSAKRLRDQSQADEANARLIRDLIFRRDEQLEREKKRRGGCLERFSEAFQINFQALQTTRYDLRVLLAHRDSAHQPKHCIVSPAGRFAVAIAFCRVFALLRDCGEYKGGIKIQLDEMRAGFVQALA
jgi:hypothetical protein